MVEVVSCGSARRKRPVERWEGRRSIADGCSAVDALDEAISELVDNDALKTGDVPHGGMLDCKPSKRVGLHKSFCASIRHTRCSELVVLRLVTLIPE